MLKPKASREIPDQTREVAWAAFPKGAQFMVMRDELGAIFDDQEFAFQTERTGMRGNPLAYGGAPRGPRQLIAGILVGRQLQLCQ